MTQISQLTRLHLSYLTYHAYLFVRTQGTLRHLCSTSIPVATSAKYLFSLFILYEDRHIDNLEISNSSFTQSSTHTALMMESSADISQQACHSRATSLEDLPVEIKIIILSHTPDLSSLSNILHASPSYYRAYCGAREEVLHAMTIHTLQEHQIGLLDPWTAVHGLQPAYDTSCRVEIVKERLNKYAQGSMDGSRRRLAPEDSLAIMSLHEKFSVLISNYCKNKFSRNPLSGSLDDDPVPPSQLELHRLYKALWRFKIYSNFFGPLSMHDIAPPDPTISEDEIACKFFGLFPMYEVEELACLQKYARDYYYSLSAEDHYWSLSCEEDQLVARGPEELYEVMTAAASEFGRDFCMAEGEKAGRVYVTMRAALDAYERDVSLGSPRWKELYANFHSEGIPTTGWLWASSRGVQNTDFRLRRWGYVFWDQRRLDHWGITKDKMVNWPRPACMLYAYPP